MIESIRACLPKLVNVVVARTGEALDELSGDREPAPDEPSDANDVMRIAFTSGTTGDPKAVMHTSKSTLFSIQQEIQERGVGRDSTLLVLLPVGLNAGFFAVVETALAGARTVLMERFQAAAALDLVTRYRVTNFIAAPSAILAILADDRLGTRDLSSLRVVQTGGASTPVNVLREANDHPRRREHLATRARGGRGQPPVRGGRGRRWHSRRLFRRERMRMRRSAARGQLDLGGARDIHERRHRKYKLPQRLELFEAFPLGPTGKVLKRELADTIEKLRGTP